MIIDFDEQRQSLVFGYPSTVTDWLSALESACSNIYDYTNYTLPSHLSINQSYVK